ncbi:MAG: MoxR family ATPase [Schleiferiaceae bacterium]|jgi:MoxR-like ATPase|nr:MoxR family ATPase [Schleiferiaceae bacterium]MDR9441818.1 MoxR family ATPase [Schleiferiaceae bacterium]
MPSNDQQDVEAVKLLGQKYQQLRDEIGKIIVGQREVVDLLLLSILCRGHSLLVGVPGLAKTLLVNTTAEALGLSFRRIQFTPDLMPSDIIGAEILDENRRFKFIKGPLFANIVLADEINRTPPKTQSALLEAMQEKAVTAAGHTYTMQEPFFVLATQNPIEQEGTYPLPEAQLDRFMFNIEVQYPSFEEEVSIVKNTTSDTLASVAEVMSGEEILRFQELIRKIPVADHIYEYAIELSQATRPGTEKASSITEEYLSWGAGPRASQYLILGAKAHAALQGKYSPEKEDIRAVARPILRHRLVKNYKAEAEGVSIDHIVGQLL